MFGSRKEEESVMENGRKKHCGIEIGTYSVCVCAGLQNEVLVCSGVSNRISREES